MEAHSPATDVSLWISLNEKGGFVTSIWAVAVHLLRPLIIGQQEVQLSGVLDEQTSSLEATKGLDADGGVSCPVDRFQDHPQGAARVYPFDRALRALQADLLNRTQIAVPHQPAERTRHRKKNNKQKKPSMINQLIAKCVSRHVA